MTDSIARIKSRGATQARLDLRGVTATRTGKTKRGKLKCTAGNVQCGNRCIPQSWDCRLEGKGTNSELKAASFDPLGGVASVERGVKTIAKNPTSIQSWDRGRNSIVRGFVKATPGDNLEKKKQLKRKLQKYGNQIGAVVLTGVAVVGAHQSAKRLSRSYRQGTGRKIDMAAFGAVDAVLDRTPFVGRSRQQTRNTAAGVSEGMAGAVGYQFRKQGIENRSMVNTGRVGPLSYPPGGLKVKGAGVFNPQDALKKRVQFGEDEYKRVLAKKPIRDFGRKPGSKALQVDKDNWLKKSEIFKNNTKDWQTQLDIASSKRVGFDEWVKESTKILYGAKTGTVGDRSAYSDDAANRFLTRQFGLSTSSVFQRGPGVDTGVLNQTQRNKIVVSELGEKLRGWGGDLEADMTLKRIPKDSNGNFDRNEVMKYIDSSVLPKMNFNQRGFTASQQNNARIKARSLAADLLVKRKGVTLDYSKVAGNMRGETVSRYNEYFKEVAQNMNIPAAAKNSPFGDGQVGLARFVSRPTTTGAGRVNPIKSRDQASLILRDYYTRNVVGDTKGSFTASEDVVRRVAQQINGGNEAPDTNTAYTLVRESGIKSLRSPSEVGSLAKPQKKPTERRGVKTGLERQRDQSELARKIMQREGFTGDYAAALKKARNELNGRKRTDNENFIPPRVGNYLQTREDLRGKPCGNSHIPKVHKCRKGKGAEQNKTPQGKGKGLVVAAAVTTIGALSIGGVLAYKNRQSLVPSISQKSIRALSSDQVKRGLEKIPGKLGEDARQLVGDAKLGAARMALSAQGANCKSVNLKDNFSTWVNKDGTHLSIGSIGDSLLTFGSQRKGTVGGFPQFGLGFTIDTTYDSKGGMPPSQASKVIRTTRSMFKDQMDQLPENAVLFAVPHQDDGKGGKRKSIYESVGFTSLNSQGVKGDRLWALKNQGKFTKIPSEQGEYIAKLILG